MPLRFRGHLLQGLYFDNGGMIPPASSVRLISLFRSQPPSEILEFSLCKLTQAGRDHGFLTTEATLWITLAWNIVRKKKVHDPELNFGGRACPHLVWAKHNSEMSQEDLENDQEAIPRLIPLAWILGTMQGHSCPGKFLKERNHLRAPRNISIVCGFSL